MVMAVRTTLRFVRLMDGEPDSEVDMPACEREVSVGPYHDGELSPDAREEFEAHLATCATCAAELERVRGVARWLEPLRRPALTGAEKDELARAAVRAAAGEEEARRQRMTLLPGRAVRWARWVTAAAAALFLFSVIQLFRAQHGSPDGTDAGNGTVIRTNEQGPTPPRRSSPATGRIDPRKNDNDALEPGGNNLRSQPDVEK